LRQTEGISEKIRDVQNMFQDACSSGTDPRSDKIKLVVQGPDSVYDSDMIKAEKVDMPASRMKLEIAKILKEEGFIKAYKILKDKKQGILRVTLKYTRDNEPVITGLRKISKPGRRVYVGHDAVPTVMGGVGISILSTSQGIFADRTCRREKTGGEVLCYIW
jgi:small subunit ribosomal protein S8